MNLFLNTSNLSGFQLDGPSLDISDTIERECLSVLHKLHDQVNGLQLVQVVVQPLARLFNPASLAALAANNNNTQITPPSSINLSTSKPTHVPSLNTSGNSYSSASSSPQTQQPPTIIGHKSDYEPSTSSGAAAGSRYNNHTRSQSFASSQSLSNCNSSSILSNTSTYMMSPDTAQALIARLDTDRDVIWLMEIIGYGLSMPFSITGEQDSVKDCCTIYCEWLASSLLPYDESNQDARYQQLSKLVPVPIRREPNRYARKMLSHLYSVFLPRQPVKSLNSSMSQKDTDTILTAVSRQAVLCHRVLRTIENVAHNQTNLMDNETWNHLLALLLTVNDKLLSPPTEPDDIGTQLHDRILGVLFDLILLACSRSVLDNSLWKTFHEMCLNWRHRPALVDHWKRITVLLTKRIVSLTTSSPKPNSNHASNLVHSAPGNSNSVEISISSMNYEALSQTWFKFLNLVGNPVELSEPSIISKTDEFYHATNNVVDPRQHPCLNALPQIFHNSVLGLKEIIDIFIENQEGMNNFIYRTTSQAAATKVKQYSNNNVKNVSERPKCNSILQIFADWLFGAALIGSELNQEVSPEQTFDSCNRSSGASSITSSNTTEFVASGNHSPAFNRRQSHQSSSSQASVSTGRQRNSRQMDNFHLNINPSERITLEPPLSADSFELGQAEAIGVLCWIFASKTTTEDISPTYLARFYLCLQHCLAYGCGQDGRQNNINGMIRRQLLASVMINSTGLFQRDLDGINLLIPSFVKAIEYVLESGERDVPIQPPPRMHSRTGSVRHGAAHSTQHSPATNQELRRACILNLINFIAYPFHFQDLVIRNCLDGTLPTVSFGLLRPKLLRLLFLALQTETDSTNMQILFSGLALAIHDSVANVDKLTNPRDEPSGHEKNSSSSSRVEGAVGNIEFGSEKDGDDTTSQCSFVFNSKDGFIIKSLHVTCHLLINIWKQDNSVSLAALEVLTTIARLSACLDQDAEVSLNINNNDDGHLEMKGEYMQTTRWICDYICNQCSRPPPAHSRDMHSTIVAAYQCLSAWIYNHPYLLNDDNCVSTLMEVIELGVSGQKSKSNSNLNSSSISKGDKQMKPSSMRVREAAESLLNICMVRTRQPGPANLETSDTTLDEVDIVDLFGDPKVKLQVRHIQDDKLRLQEAYRMFKYFSDEDSVIIGLFGLPNDLSTVRKDSVVCLLRTAFGKHCWTMGFNYFSEKFEKKFSANRINQPNQKYRPSSTIESRSHSKSSDRTSIKNIAISPPTNDDLTPTSLNQLVVTMETHDKGRDKTEHGAKSVTSRVYSHQLDGKKSIMSGKITGMRQYECPEPQPASNLDAARMIATHLGFNTSLNSLHSNGLPSDGFIESLGGLDSLPIRSCDTANIFYVRRNRTHYMEVFESVRERHDVSFDFFSWLLDLGNPVVVKEHERWTGKIYKTSLDHNTSSNNSKATRNQMLMSDQGGAIFDGNLMSLHWSDMCQEIVFLAPHRPEKVNSNIIICWLECPDDLSAVPCDTLLSICQNGESAADETNSMDSNSSTSNNQRSMKPKDYAKYFISPTKNGLYRVNIITSVGRQWLALPLVDGATVSKRMLAGLLRESILNLCRRSRLDADSHQPPHVRRRLRIQDICNTYKTYNQNDSGDHHHNLFRCGSVE